MSSIPHYFIGGVLLSSSSTWLQYFIGQSLSVSTTVTSFASGDITIWRWSMILGIVNGVWALSLLSPSSIEGIGGWTLHAPFSAIMAGLASGISAKLCWHSSYEDPLSAYTNWAQDIAYYYGAAFIGGVGASLFANDNSKANLPAHQYQFMPSIFQSISLGTILVVHIVLFMLLKSQETSRYLSKSSKEAAVGYICGVYYVMGLCYCGLLCPSTAKNFVNVRNPSRLDLSWIASLAGAWAFRYGFATQVNMGPAKRPIFNARRRLVTDVQGVQRNTLIGSGISGIAWALKGMSIGPALIIMTCRPSISIASFCFCYAAAYFAADQGQKMYLNSKHQR